MDQIAGNRIKQLRKEANLNQKELCRLLSDRYGMNTPQSTISRWETGEQEPTVANLKTLADIFGVSIAYICGQTNDRRRSGLTTFSAAPYDIFCDDDTFDGMPDEWRKLHSKIDSASGAKRELIDKVLSMTDEQAAAWNCVIKP